MKIVLVLATENRELVVTPVLLYDAQIKAVEYLLKAVEIVNEELKTLRFDAFSTTSDLAIHLHRPLDIFDPMYGLDWMVTNTTPVVIAFQAPHSGFSRRDNRETIEATFNSKEDTVSLRVEARLLEYLRETHNL